MKPCGIQLRVIPQEMLKIFILDTSLKITNWRLQLHVSRAKELTDNADVLQWLLIWSLISHNCDKYVEIGISTWDPSWNYDTGTISF